MTDGHTTTDPADVLRRAANLMRAHASEAYEGPWISDDSDQCWRLHSAPDPQWPTMQILKAPKQHNCPQYEEYWPDAGTGLFITKWHPVIAYQVANLLDAVRQSPPPALENPGTGLVWIMALRLAHEYLGAVGEDDGG